MRNHGRFYDLTSVFFFALLIISSSFHRCCLQHNKNDLTSFVVVFANKVPRRLDFSAFSTIRKSSFSNPFKPLQQMQTVYVSNSNIRTPKGSNNRHYAAITPDSKLSSIERKIEAKKWLTNQVNLYQNHVKLASAALTKAKIKVADLPFNPMEPGFKKDIEVKISSNETPYPCRIYIDAEPGSKVVAPCKCRGTQKWIQLAALNRQRRLEPEKWIKCSVCNSEIDYTKYHRYVPQLLKLVSWPLDHQERTKVILGGSMTVLGLFASVPLYILGVNMIASGFFWRYYHLWSWVVYGALPLKLVVVRFLLGYVFSLYSSTEKLIRENLTELETSILELSIPVSA